jgi:hypothetical protein
MPTRPAEDRTLACPGRAGASRSPKILDLHLERLAVVSIRQSDAQQVLDHRESRERQCPPGVGRRIIAVGRARF